MKLMKTFNLIKTITCHKPDPIWSGKTASSCLLPASTFPADRKIILDIKKELINYHKNQDTDSKLAGRLS